MNRRDFLAASAAAGIAPLAGASPAESQQCGEREYFEIRRYHAIPGPQQRWRCGACGNLTRFDVTRSRRTTEYWHFDLAGDHRVEDVEVLDESLESVSCR